MEILIVKGFYSNVIFWNMGGYFVIIGYSSVFHLLKEL